MTKEELSNVKVGDKVICLKHFSGHPEKGWVGTIVYVEDYAVSVEWEKDFPTGHNCGGDSKENRGRNYFLEKDGNRNIDDKKYHDTNQNICILGLVEKYGQLELF